VCVRARIYVFTIHSLVLIWVGNISCYLCITGITAALLLPPSLEVVANRDRTCCYIDNIVCYRQHLLLLSCCYYQGHDLRLRCYYLVILRLSPSLLRLARIPIQNGRRKQMRFGASIRNLSDAHTSYSGPLTIKKQEVWVEAQFLKPVSIFSPNSVSPHLHYTRPALFVFCSDMNCRMRPVIPRSFEGVTRSGVIYVSINRTHIHICMARFRQCK
jgi:hypothetical protein